MKSVLLLRQPTEPEEKLFNRYDDASRKVKQGMSTAKGGSGTEQTYSVAYQDLVKLGLAQQIKKKYR